MEIRAARTVSEIRPPHRAAVDRRHRRGQPPDRRMGHCGRSRIRLAGGCRPVGRSCRKTWGAGHVCLLSERIKIVLNRGGEDSGESFPVLFRFVYTGPEMHGGSCVSGRFMPGGCAAARGSERDCAVQGGRIAVATDRKVVRRAGMSVREERVVQQRSWRQSGETCIGTVCRFVWRRAHPAVFLPAGDRTCEDDVERPIPTRTSGYKREGLCISEAISSAGRPSSWKRRAMVRMDSPTSMSWPSGA